MPVSRHEQLELVASPEARDKRRQSKLGKIAVPKPPIRGKQRVSAFEYRKPGKPDQLPFETVEALGKGLADEPILTDEITKYHNPLPDASSIEAYLNGAVKRNGQLETTRDPQARRDILKAKRRAFHHAADKLQRQAKTKAEDARISRAAIASVQTSIHTGDPIDPAAAHYTSAAIEDFGICLRERTDITDDIDYERDLPTYFEQIGVYTVNDPEELRNHPHVLRLVRLEQVKRQAHWGRLWEVCVEEFDDRSTRQDKLDEEQNDALIISFGNVE